MYKKTDTKVPEFNTLEEEKKYWEERGPLAEGRKGRINRPEAGQKRNSFLAVRLTGDELTCLRDTASRFGVGPSTFARLVLTSAIKGENVPKGAVTVEELMESVVRDMSPQDKERTEKLAKEIAIGDPKNPSFVIIDAGNKKAVEDFTMWFLGTLASKMGARIVTPQNSNFQAVKEAARTEFVARRA